tara:strand:- start:2848 stop:5802 length:2955 start_codon:yes stop_codon:yes gene_type:complete
MSIKAKPWDGGAGGATVPDASETTKGKIQIATSDEATTGTDDLKAMTPLTVKERIDAALVGGVEYKGSYTGQSLVTAEQGDLYVSAATYSLAGVQVLSGDHIIFNQDASDPVTSTMFDKIDNTDQVSSVNTLTGAVVLNGANLDGDHSPSNYSVTSDKIEKHLEGIDTALGARQPLDAQLTDVAGLTPTNNHVIIGDSSNFTAAQLASTQLSDSADLARLASPAFTGSPTAPTQSASDNSTKIATTAYVDSAVTSAGGNQITDIEEKAGSTFTAEANHLYICGYTLGTQTITFPDASSSTTGDIIGLSTQNATRAVSLVSSDGTTNDLKNNSNQTKGGTNGALSLSIHRQVSWFVSDGALWLEVNAALKPVATTGAYSDLSGTPSLATVATTGAYSDLSGTPSLATVATTGAYSDLSGTPTVPSDLNDLSDVTITGAGTGEVLRYSGSAWVDAQLAYSDLSGTPSLATVATTGAYSDLSGTPSLATVATSGAYSDLSGTPTVPTTLNTLTDVSISNVSNGQVISYNSTSGEWENSTPSSGGATDLNGLSDVTITGAAAGNLLERNGAGQFVNVVKSTIDVGDFNDDNTYQPKDAKLTDIAGLTPADGKFIVGDGSSFVTESGATARASLGLVIGTDVAAIASPAFTGSPTAPTQSAGDDSTKIATTAYVDSAVTAGGGATDLNGLSDVTITSAASGNLLQHNGSGQFVNVAKSTINVGTFNDDNTYQPKDAKLTDVAGLTPADGAFIVGDGNNFVAESGATARTSLGAIAELSEDSSPQLGADLDVNGYDISTVSSNAKIGLKPHGTGFTELIGNTTGGNNAGSLRFNCEHNTHGVILKSPLHNDYASSGDYTLTLPTGLPASDKVLQSSSTGVLSWVAQSGGGGGGSAPTVTSASPGTAYAISTHADNEEVYLLTPSADIAVNFPAASAAGSGYRYHIKNLSGSYNLTLTPASGTIDGASTYVTSAQNEAVTCVSDGSNWFII